MGKSARRLIDSGCSQTLVSKAVCRFWKRKSAGVLTADGRTLNCRGYGKIKVEVDRVPAVEIEALVVDKQLLDFDLLLGIDAIKLLGGVYLTESGETRFGGLNRCAAIFINERTLAWRTIAGKKNGLRHGNGRTIALQRTE